MKIAPIKIESRYLSYEPGMAIDDFSVTLGWDLIDWELSIDNYIGKIFFAIDSPIEAEIIPPEEIIEVIAEKYRLLHQEEPWK